MTDRLLEELEAEARYHRERLALYRAKAYGLSPTSEVRLRELVRAGELADKRLRHARREIRMLPGREPKRFEEKA